MRVASVILRRFVGRRAPCVAARSSSISDDLIVSSAAAAASYSTLILTDDAARPLFVSGVSPGAVTSAFHLNHSRNFSSPPSSGMYLQSTSLRFGFVKDHWLCGVYLDLNWMLFWNAWVGWTRWSLKILDWLLQLDFRHHVKDLRNRYSWYYVQVKCKIVISKS